MDENQTIPKIKDYRIDVAGRGRGKGAAIFQKEELIGTVEAIVERSLQIMKIEFDKLDVVNVYRSGDKSLFQTAEILRDFLSPKKATLVSGDFNVCLRENKNNQITKTMERLGFRQMVTEATQIEGRLIDHVYWRDYQHNWKDPDMERYSPYYSDHDAFLITLQKVLIKTNFNLLWVNYISERVNMRNSRIPDNEETR